MSLCASASRANVLKSAPLLAGLAAITSPDVAASPFTHMVPMRDGVRLATDVYAVWPFDGHPALLVRTPYGRQTDVAAVDPEWVDLVNAEKYVYVVQDVRGRYDSEGDVPLFSTDGWGTLQDGYDTIEWIAAQTWCDGNVAMYGESARGMLQYLAAGSTPPSLRACVTRIACEDFYMKAFFQGGGFRESLVVDWFNSVDEPGDVSYYVDHPLRDTFWDDFDLHTRLANIEVPILHIGGHYDIFGESAVDAFHALQTAGGPGAAGNQKLILGPWSHRGINQETQGELQYEHGELDLDHITFRWLNYWVKGDENGIENDPPVHYYLMSDPLSPAGNRWMTGSHFGDDVYGVNIYLHGPSSPSGASLQLAPSPIEDDTFTYTTDPMTPRITRGGRNLFLDEGPYDQRPVYEGRDDGVLLESPPFTFPITIVGNITAEIFASSTTPDADFCVTLMDAYPDGRHMYITDGILRARHREGFTDEEMMVPNTVYAFEIDLWSTAYMFDVGHRVSISISHNNSRRFEVNGNDGAPFGLPQQPIPADISLHASASYPSYIKLPVTTPDLVAVGTQIPPTFHVVPSANPASRFAINVVGLGDRAGLAHVVDVGGRIVRTYRIDRGGSARDILWDGTAATGRPVASGAYTFVVRSESGETATRKLVLVR